MKKLASLIVVVIVMTFFPATSAYGYSAKAICVYEPRSGTFLETKNGDEKLPMASTTKIMTALVTLETVSLEKEIRIPDCAVGVEGSSLYLLKNEPLTVKELLYGLMLTSGNDAAYALAHYVGNGDVQNFVELMNKRAQSLGLENTNFQNPAGLPGDDHFTTAKELAIITSVALENPVFAEIVKTKTAVIRYNGNENGRTLTNHNKMLSLYEGAVGVKTGFTKKAGRCLVSAATRNGVTLVCVTLNASDDWNDHTLALDKGFERTEALSLASERNIRVELFTPDGEKVIATNKDEMSYVSVDGETPTQKILADRFVYAPKKKDSVVGEVLYIVNGKTVARSDLVLECDLPAEIKKELLISRLIKFIRNLF